MGRKTSEMPRTRKVPRKLKKAIHQIRLELPSKPFELKEVENPDGSRRLVFNYPFRITFEGKDNKWKRKARAKAMDEYKRSISRELQRMYNL